jgi:hypothetical protein
MRTAIPLRFACLSVAVGLSVSPPAQAQLPGSNIMPANTISITSFSPDTFFLNSLSVSVPLRHTVAGLTPTHYRVSHFSDFRDAKWLVYVPAPTTTTDRTWFTADAGQNARFTGSVFFQLRARNPNAGQPMSLGGTGLPESPGGTSQKTSGVTVQPDFINSNVKSRTLHVVFAG